MTVEQLKKRGALYFERIQEGLDNYNFEILKMMGGEAFERIWDFGKKAEIYADFYYYRLSEESKIRVEGLLTEEEMDYLRKIRPEGDVEETFIFPVTEELLPILLKLNEKEMLFSTFYFIRENGKNETWWGNYCQEYIRFWAKG